MLVLRRIFFALVAIVIILVAVAYVLPPEVTMSRQIDIAAPPSIVFPLVGNLRKNGKWSPWLGLDPNIKVTFSGPTVGIGQRMNWVSDNKKVGTGSQTVIGYEPDRRVVTALDFRGSGIATATTTVTATGAGSHVTWGFDTDLGLNPLARYFGLVLERMVAPDYERGLARLKEVAEATAAPAPAPTDAAGPADGRTRPPFRE